MTLSENRRLPKFLIVSAFVCGLAFYVKAMVTAYCNRLVYDDFRFLGAVRQYGILGGQIHWWKTWQGRWSSTFLTMLTAEIAHTDGKIFFYSFATFTGLVLGMVFFLHHLFRRLWWSDSISRFGLWSIALLMSYLVYTTTFCETESWHWLCACSNYAWPVIFGLFAGGVLVKIEQDHRDIFLVTLLFFFISGGAEMVAALTISLTGGLCAYEIWKRKNLKPIPWKFALPLAASLASLVIAITAPGNRIRAPLFDYHENVLHSVGIALVNSLLLMVELWKSKKYWLMGSALFWMILGAWNQNTEIPRSRFPWKKLGIAFAILYAWIFISILPNVMMTGLNPTTRIWIVFSATFLGFFSYLGFLLGTHFFTREKLAIKYFASILMPIILISAGGYQLSLLNRAAPRLFEYAKAYDEMYAELLRYRAEGRTETLWLKPLPYTSYYQVMDIGETQSWVSDAVRWGLQLPYEVRAHR